ncbi:MAG: prolipoprotein diacylglyceryl transferase [Coraliomargaritaceae bacterium]|jgi:phosphatidylglycerol:prolipoprotein diacylglycerol transferase|nr:prolipoprotein diacylglyceryl transferase [Puniceicoccaceae bacterium]|tara:strand:+ start:816 stop:1661 length:846 start_codon:yes stop_codon:yes gene_type:complete
MSEKNLDYWVHDLSPFLLEFPENPLGLEGIRFYGLSYLLGFLLTWWFLYYSDKKERFPINARERSDFMTYIILGVLIGGRLGYMLFYDLNDFLANPLLFFRIDQGGMSSHGGIIGVLFVHFLFTKQRNYNPWSLGDCIVSIAPLGIMLGRLANFMNGELWGKITTVPWAVLFPNSPMSYSTLTDYYGIQPRHPSQIYASLSEGFIPLIYLQYRFWFTKYSSGQLVGEFLILYSAFRIFNELFRAPDAALIMGLSRGQFYSIFLLVIGFIIFVKRKRHKALY